jgi:hypothetical protein
MFPVRTGRKVEVSNQQHLAGCNYIYKRMVAESYPSKILCLPY